MAKRILVTGGAGFIGSHLVDALLDAGHAVRVFDSLDPQVHGGLRDAGKWPGYCCGEAEYVLGDVRDGDSLRKVMRGVDAVFHQAAAVGVAQSMYDIERYVEMNTLGTAILLDILVNDVTVRDRVGKVVVASSMSVYGEGSYMCPRHGEVYPGLRNRLQLEARDPEMYCPVDGSGRADRGFISSAPGSCGLPLQPVATAETKPLCCTSIYAITKRDQEEMCLTTGWASQTPVVALRYFNVYGPRQALSNPYTGVAAIFSSRILNGRAPVVFEDGRQSRDFTHVSDIVQANLLMLEDTRADYRVFNVGTGRSLTILDMAEALQQELGSSQAPLIRGEFRAGDIRHCFADITQIGELGYTAKVRFEDGICDLVDWVQQQMASDDFERALDELASRGLTV